MQFFRQYISPLLIFLIFLLALVAVSARIFLPSDMLAPAPVSVENINLYLPEPVVGQMSK
ncbi:MAG: hypothetical protein AB4368_02015 [Xenococcaceae cyanobacterium]